MSSVTFPSHLHGSSTSEPSIHDSHFYTGSFVDASAAMSASGFQMNPLSPHPPRTPRTSATSPGPGNGHGHINGNGHARTSSLRSSKIYDLKVEESEKSLDDGLGLLDAEEESDDGEDDGEDLRLKEAEKRVRKEDVWREMVLTSDGRDKAFKLIQYSIKVYLLFHSSLTTSRLLRHIPRRPWEVEFVKRLNSTASGLSFSRKLLLLFNWLGPLTAVTSAQSASVSPVSARKPKGEQRTPFLEALLYAPPPVLLDLVSAISDDVYTLSMIGLLGKRIGERAEKFANWCWLISTVVGLVENGVERSMIGNLQNEVESRLYNESMTGATSKSKGKSAKLDEKELARLQRRNYWLQISRTKLLMDLIFSSYDVFHIKKASTTVKALSGLAAAILSGAKLFDKHKTTLSKALVKTLL
ncbi:hypothetical protein D9758_001212 [Tetrapyrgos nigripes]|uniref:Uncharacterized protein n=1 Tax=Tetrapyrgos nigripes TaxID=182062 RepID=A0A8H5GRP8_9AGAR|nr:hypothetical protein D9758_001212 [Tetrapyrgos nigripes]